MYIYKGTWKMASIHTFFESYTNTVYSPRQYYQCFGFVKLSHFSSDLKIKYLFGYLCLHHNAVFFLPFLMQVEH